MDDDDNRWRVWMTMMTDGRCGMTMMTGGDYRGRDEVWMTTMKGKEMIGDSYVGVDDDDDRWRR